MDLSPGGHHLSLHRQVEPRPGGEGDGGGLQRVTMKSSETGMNEGCVYIYIYTLCIGVQLYSC